MYTNGTRIEAAQRLLEAHGFADLARWLDGYPPVGQPEEPAPSAVARMLLDDVPAAFALWVDGRRLQGSRGRVLLSPALRLLLRGLQAPGEWVEHGYTPQSAERLLRAARGDLAYVEPGLAERLAVPIVEPGRVRVGYRDPTRLVVRDAGDIN